MTRLFCRLAALILLPAAAVHAESKTFELTVAAGLHNRTDTPVRVLLPLPGGLAKAESVALQDASGRKLPAQLTAPGLLAATSGKEDVKELHFLLPGLQAGTTTTLKVTVSTEPPNRGTESFAWKQAPDQTAELSFGTRPVLLYMGLPYDDASKETRDRTYKVFHHLYDPDGRRPLTQGAGGKVFPHHRGIYYGFSNVTTGAGQRADTWHCTNNVYQAHEKFLAREAGPFLGRHLVEVGWHGPDKSVFATELRELTVYRVPGGTLVEFASRLRSTGGTVKVDGDPQHAGFQFRAASEVAEKTKNQTYYLRPDGTDKPGATRNWDKKRPDFHANLPWNAMSFVVGGERYTIAYLDRPGNPKPARFSERDYGRFGSYFVAETTEAKPLDVAYRLWLRKGEMKAPEAAARAADFAEPPTVTLK